MDTLYLSAMWLGDDLRIDTKTLINGNLIGSMRIFTFLMNKIFMWCPIIARQMATGIIWIC